MSTPSPSQPQSLSTLSPSRSLSPASLDIIAGTDDTLSEVRNASFLVFEIMGIGTFLLFFFFVVLLVVFIFSTYCTTKKKVLSRILSTLLFLIVFLVLIFAQRQDINQPGGFEEKVKLYKYMYLCICM